MFSGIDKRAVRQAKCINRGKRARMYGRVLIPITLLVLGQALWSDPDLGPQLAEGLKEIKPVLATYAQGTPLEGTFGPVSETAEPAASSGLPQIGEAVAAARDTIKASFTQIQTTATSQP